ncbi:magnesium/cobalt transporter CorA [Thermoproteota archaeon]
MNQKKRSKYNHRQAKTAGLVPGTLIHIGEQKLPQPIISLINYNQKSVSEKTNIIKFEQLKEVKDPSTISWLNIDGLHDTELMEKLSKFLALHPLTMEDILNTGQRPKCEEYKDYIFCVLKMIYFNPKTHELQTEQVSLILNAHFVVSFQEIQGDVFDHIRDRIQKTKGRIRSMGPDYLLYSLIDAIIDNYFVVLETLSDRIEAIEDKLITIPSTEDLHEIYRLKRQVLIIKKSAWPLREAVSMLYKTDHPLFQNETRLYCRDVYDHTIQSIDTIETLRDMMSGMLDVYLTSINNKMNEVMKVLTIFASIFIPLTFIAGVYGMNFTFMPELEWKYGYAMIWGIMLTVFVLMLILFKRKKWF